MYQKTEKGITLVALVITIIVLLILAGVTLSIVFNGGIIDKSQNAVDQYAYQSKNEEEQLEDFERWMEQYFDGKSEGKPIPIVVDNTNGDRNRSAIENEDPSYQNPVIPMGFKTKDTDNAKWETTDGEILDNWDNGLVIVDSIGNEFVWVPAQQEGGKIEGLTKYEKWDAAITYVKEENTKDDRLPTKVIDIWNENEESQIKTYGGFYIARYEAGIPDDFTTALGEGTASSSKRNNTKYSSSDAEGTKTNENIKPVSQKNAVPWNYIDYNNSKTNAENMYSTKYVQSGLVTGTMWDTVMKWMENSNPTVNVQTDSGAWGNHKDIEVTGITSHSGDKGATWTDATSKPENICYILKTGNSEYTKRKNIYDLAGNLFEWTNEIHSSYCVVRGGDCDNDSSGYPAACRYDDVASDASCYLSFRVVLYISSTEN